MNQRIILIVILLIVGQTSYVWLATSEGLTVSITTMFFAMGLVGVFVMLSFSGYRWAKWIVLLLMAYDVFISIVMVADGVFTFLLPLTCYLLSTYMLLVFKAARKEVSTGAVEVPGGFVVADQVFKYPTLIKRYQSVLIDGLLIFTVLIVTMVSIGDAPYRQAVMVTMGALFLFIYEPVLTVYSSTIGQRTMGIRVRSVRNPNERINLLHAYLRIIVKWLLGWLSFITIHFNPQHRAIHDMAGESVVVKV